MTTLDDLKNLIATHNNARPNFGDWSVAGSFATTGALIEWETLEQLVKIAEAAFEFADLWEPNSFGRYVSNGTVRDFRRLHLSIQALKKELESE